MTWESWVYAGLFLVWFVVEMIGLKQKDRPGHPRTLSANIWWLVQGASAWHQIARGVLTLGMAVLTIHLLE